MIRGSASCAAFLLMGLVLSPQASAADLPCATPELEALRRLITDEGRLTEAEEKATRILEAERAAHGPESLQAACTADVVLESLMRQHRTQDPSTLNRARQVVEIKRIRLGRDHPEVARSLTTLGWILQRRDDLRGAEEAFREALQIRKTSLGAGAIETAWISQNLGNVLVAMGRYDDARAYLEGALAQIEKIRGSHHPELASSFYSLGWLQVQRGAYDEARRLYGKSLEIVDKPAGPQRYRATQVLLEIANVEDRAARHHEALEWIDRALRRAREREAEEPVSVAKSLAQRALILRNLGDAAQAEQAALEALAILDLHPGTEESFAASIKHTLCEIRRDMGDLALAARLCQEALETRERLLGPDHPDCGSSHEALAAIAGAQGRHEEAIDHYERALVIWRGKLAADHPDNAVSLNGLGVTYAALDRPAEARRSLEEALRIRRVRLGPSHPATAVVTANLARLAWRSGEDFRALELAIETERIATEHARLLAEVLPERQAIRYALRRPAGIDLALTIATYHPRGAAVGRAWDLLIRSRALVLDEMISRYQAADTAGGSSRAALRSEFAQARRRLAWLTLRGPDPSAPERYLDVLRSASDEAERLERALAEASLPHRNQLTIRSAGLREISAALPPRTALVAYARFSEPPGGHSHPPVQEASRAAGEASRPFNVPDSEPRSVYAAFVLAGAQGGPSVVPLGGAGRIEGLVESWRQAVRGTPGPPGSKQDAEVSYRATARRLRREIWDPVEEHLGDVERVFIVPDGTLSLVDFGTLPVGTDRYLIESDVKLHYLSTERDLLRAAEPRELARGLLVLGGPDFEERTLFASLRDESRPPAFEATATTSGLTLAAVDPALRGACGALRTMRFQNLPASRQEAEEIVGIWRRAGRGRDGKSEPAVLLAGAMADEASFRRLAVGKRVLHLATHGFFAGDRCPTGRFGSRSVEMMGPAEERSPAPVVGENPLLLAGLALAGANHREAAGPDEEDGVLTAAEVAAMDLSGVEWAVLAACDTGTGRIETGEGVLGLRRAFQIAGARTIIMNLWSVQDIAARRWMTALYQNRTFEGMDTISAVHAASAGLLRWRRTAGESTHPGHWGGWIATGAWE